MRLGLVAALLAVSATAAFVAVARERPVAVAQVECADPGVVTDYNTFVLGDHRVTNDSVDGRMAVGRDAIVNQFGAGNRLAADAARVDLVVGRNIQASNARANNGSIIYGGTVTGQISALGTVTNATPPFDMSLAFIALRSTQESWADLAPNGTVTPPEFSYSPIQFTGTDANVNVFRVSAGVLQSAQVIQIRVPLDLCKTPSRRRVTAGTKVTYRLRIRNVGLPPARRVVVCDPVPVGLTIVKARGARVRGGRACWTVRRLGREKVFRLVARANETARGRIRNTGRARAANAARVRNPTTIRVRGARQVGACPAGAFARMAC